VAVTIALLMTVLMLFAAVVVDAGALYAERRQLQNGADAAALAVARACAISTAVGACTSTAANTAIAEVLMDANANDGAAEVAELAIAGSAVTVTGSTEESDGGDALPHAFGSILGVDATTVTAKATAAWGGPAKAVASLPLALPTCAFQLAVTPPVELAIPTKNISRAGGCKDRNGASMPPGAFGWLGTLDSSTCALPIDIAVQTGSQTGNSFPKRECEDDIIAMRNTVITLPVYDETGGSGSNGWYQVYGFAAFRLTGYSFTSGIKWNQATAPSLNGEFGIKGYFVKFVTLDPYALGGANLGFSSIALVD